MPWVYNQSTGELSHNGVVVATGYSGAGLIGTTGRNNPAMEATPDAGPIPAGQWDIGPAANSPNTGPNTITLTPTGHNAHGRTNFRVHGNNPTNNASHGCIIMPPAVRQQIINSADTVLNVVPGTPVPNPTPTPTATPTPAASPAPVANTPLT